MIRLARSFKIAVVTEIAATKDEVPVLRKLGCR
jgi:EAL domain-containing protein (putative c-di-GMP-specific phosphodiesterase class I)